MHNRLVTVLLISITAGVASAQAAGSYGSDPNALWSNPAISHVATSSGSLTNPGLAGPSINEQGPIGLGPMLSEPLGPNRKPWLSDVMAVGGGVGRSFVDPDSIQVQGNVLFHTLDLLLRADTRCSPVYFGVHPEVKFIEHHDYQPGLPVQSASPIGGNSSRWRSLPNSRRFSILRPLLPWGGVEGSESDSTSAGRKLWLDN
jgi:hypothetical protein